MTVRELIEQLQKLPADLPVVIQSDPEGNAWHPLQGAEDGLFWNAGVREVSEDEYEGGASCVVVFP